MASLTTFRGRRCTKVRRQINNTQSNTASVRPSTSAISSLSTPLTSSAFAIDQTTNTPRSSAQIASILNPPPEPTEGSSKSPANVPTPSSNSPKAPTAPLPATSAPPAATSTQIVAPVPTTEGPSTSGASSKVRSLGGETQPPVATIGGPPAVPQPPLETLAPQPPAQNPNPAPQPNPNPAPAPAPAPQPPAQGPGQGSGGGGGQGGGSPASIAPGSGGGNTIPPEIVASSPVVPNAPSIEPGAQSPGVGGVPHVSPGNVIPLPVIYTSNGATITSFMQTASILPSRPSKGTPKPVSSDLGRNNPSISSDPNATGINVNHTDPGRKATTGVIAGAVSGVVALIVISALVFFCTRRHRRKNRDSVNGRFTQTNRSVTPLTHHVRSLFQRRRSDISPNESVRSTTPALESGMRRSYMAEADLAPRVRSSSEPASKFTRRGPEMNTNAAAVGVPVLPPLALNHRRSRSSVSGVSVSGVAYPLLTETNNPFRDPDTNGSLRIINGEASMPSTPATTPRAYPLPKVQSPPAAFTGSPMSKYGAYAAAGAAGGAAAGLGAAALAKKSSNSPLANQRAFHRRTRSIDVDAVDPFVDPTESVNPFADPEPSPALMSLKSPISENSRSQTPPEYMRQVPSQRQGSNRLSHTRSRTYANIPIITKTAPSVSSSHQQNASGDSGFASASPDSVNLARFTAQNNLYANMRRQRQDSISSESSSSSGALSLRYPSSWGEPGPTRPVSYTRTETSRVSDPFDLDRPELLAAYAGSEARYSTVTLSRTGSERSVSRESRREYNERKGSSSLASGLGIGSTPSRR